MWFQDKWKILFRGSVAESGETRLEVALEGQRMLGIEEEFGKHRLGCIRFKKALEG